MNDTDKEKIVTCFGILLNSIPHIGQFYGEQAFDAIKKTLGCQESWDRLPNNTLKREAECDHSMRKGDAFGLETECIDCGKQFRSA